MPSPKSLVEPNASIDINGQRTLVAGGTSGIGAGIALRYALAGSSVYIVGRSQQRGAEVLERLKKATAEYERRRQSNKGKAGAASAEHAFFSADLTDVQQLKKVVEDVKSKTAGEGVDHLIMTQGGPPVGALEALPSGVEKHYAIQVLSRFGLAYLLTQQNLVKRSVTSVAAPGSGSKALLDVEDLDLLKAKASGKMWDGYLFGIIRKGGRDSSVIDSFSQTLAEKHPNLTVSHLFPGLVATEAVQHIGLPSPIAWAASFFASFIAYAPGPGGYAEVPLHLTNHPEGQQSIRLGMLNAFGPTLKPVSISPNVRDKGVRQQIWDKLASYF